MDRRSYLAVAGSIGATATAGCITGLFDDEPENVVLPPPEEQLADSEDLAYPAYGETFPSFELSDAVSDAAVDTGELDRVIVSTAFFASCPAECGILLNNLAMVQATTAERDLADEVVFLPITFDPERDDTELLRDNAERVGVDLTLGNWHYLRPDSPEEAERVVTDRLGIKFERIDESDRMESYDFLHPVITWLVNPGLGVERAYRGERLDHEQLVDDVETVVSEYEPE